MNHAQYAEQIRAALPQSPATLPPIQIDDGRRNNAGRCMTALACHRLAQVGEAPQLQGQGGQLVSVQVQVPQVAKGPHLRGQKGQRVVAQVQDLQVGEAPQLQGQGGDQVGAEPRFPEPDERSDQSACD